MLTPIDPVEPSIVRVFNLPYYTVAAYAITLSRSKEKPIGNTLVKVVFGNLRNPVFVKDEDPFGRRGGLLQGSLN